MLAEMYRLIAGMSSRGGHAGKVQIFIFHRVLDKPDPLCFGEPDIGSFERIISCITNVFNVIPLSEAVNHLRSKSLPKRAACITFDDGYIDNYTNAFPILNKYKVPATIFVATDFIDGGMMWNDIVIESIRSATFPISIPEIGVVNEACGNEQDKLKLLGNIIPAIKHFQQDKRTELVSAIEEATGFKRFPLMMSKDQLLELRDAGITIGAHTCSHPILKTLDDATAIKEINQSKEHLETLLGEKVELFAYPNGRPGEDYTVRDVEIVKKAGFKAAVSTEKRVASYRSSQFEIPRFTPWDMDINKFIFRSLIYNYRA